MTKINAETLDATLQQAAPFLSDLASVSLTKNLPKEDPTREAIVGFGRLLMDSKLVSNRNGAFQVEAQNVAAFVADGGHRATELMISMGGMMSHMARSQDTILPLVPTDRRESFVHHYIDAARAARTLGAAMDARSVAGFGSRSILLDGREETNVAQLAIERPESMASDASLTAVRRSMTDVLEGMHASEASIAAQGAGRSMQAAVYNAQESLRAAGYILPGQTEARRDPFSTQSDRGTREQAETIAGAGRLLFAALSDPDAQASIQYRSEGLLSGGRGVGIHTNNLGQALTGMDASAREVSNLRNAFDITPEQASAGIDLLIAAINVSSKGQLGMHTEILDRADDRKSAMDAQGRAGDEIDLARIAPTTNEAAKVAGKRAQEDISLTGSLTMETQDDGEPMTNAVGTVIVPRKDFDALQSAHRRVRESGLLDTIESLTPRFAAHTEATRAFAASERDLSNQENRLRALSEDAHERKRDLVSSDVALSTITRDGAAALFTETRRAQSRVPFDTAQNASLFQDILVAAGDVVERTGLQAKNEVVVYEDRFAALGGPVDSLLRNNGQYRMIALAGRSPSEVERVADNRDVARYATVQEASQDAPGVRQGDRPDSGLVRQSALKPEMSSSEWSAYKTMHASSPERLAKTERMIFFFDPNKKPESTHAASKEDMAQFRQVRYNRDGADLPSVPRTGGAEPADALRKEPANRRGLVDLEAMHTQPASLEDRVNGRSDLQRAFMARMTRPDGQPNIGFRNELMRFQEATTPIIVSDNLADAKMLRAAARGADALYREALTEQANKWAKNPDLPKGQITLPAAEVRTFVQQARLGHPETLPQLTVRDNRIVLEHPDAASLVGKESNMEAAKSWRAPASREAPAQSGTTKAVLNTPTLDLDRLDRVSANATRDVAFKFAGTLLIGVQEAEAVRVQKRADTARSA